MHSSKNNRLLVWSLASFHSILLVVSLVALLHWYGKLGAALGRLNTLVGLALFAVLWFSTWWSAGKVLQDVEFSIAQYPPPMGKLLACGMRRGAANGLMFLFPLVFIVLLSIGAGDTFLQSILAALIFAFVQSLFGSLLAFPIGLVLGLLFAAIDIILMKISHYLFLACTQESNRERSLRETQT